MQEHLYQTDINIKDLENVAIILLQKLVSIPSFSTEEESTAEAILDFLKSYSVSGKRKLNNVWAVNKHFSENKSTIILNSHHDTVKPNRGYTRDPFSPSIMDGKLFGLGSNDAGAALVSLLASFIYFYDKELKYNLVIAATSEEEISGQNGIEALLNDKGFICHLTGEICAIVGEPTLMQMAVAEKGLMVLDCTARGKAGHAAREEGTNAIYIANKDISWIENFVFPKISELLGPVKMTVTSISTGNKSHNIIPDECTFIVDIRINELYTFEEVLNIFSTNTLSEAIPRSTRLKSSAISKVHPLVVAGGKLGKASYGSPTTSDMALIPFPSLKIGPGNSARSHSADEFIYLDELREGIRSYIEVLKQLL